MSNAKRIYLSPPHMSGNELKYIHEAFEQNWIAPLGPNVDNFEKELARYLGVKHVAALSSGTAAIHLALIMLGVGSGDYVIVQSFTFAATVFPVKYLGATPVFVDSEPETWNMDPELLEKAINLCMKTSPRPSRVLGTGSSKKESENSQEVPGEGSNHYAQDQRNELKDSSLQGGWGSLNKTIKGERRKEKVESKTEGERKVKAIIGVNLYGMPAKWDEILAIGKKYGIPVIEDAAESLGSRYNGKMCGSLGEMGILSFNGNKIITTSGGGALVSDNEEYIRKARFLSTQARDNAPHYQHSETGYNYRMSNIVAGIGRGQMEVIEERVKKRRDNFYYYKNNLSGLKGVSFIDEPGEAYFSNRWLTTILIDPEVTGIDREQVRLALEKENIETRPLWKPMHLQPVFSGYPAFVNGTSERLFSQGLCLPSGSNMSEEDREKVVEIICKVLKV